MARTELSESVKAEAIAAGWKLRHIRINPPDGTGQLVCQDAYGRTLMLNGTWTMDPLQAGGWNNAATVRINKDYYSYSRRSAVPGEPFPPINPHAIVQAPAEDEDVLTRSKISVLDDNIQASPITAEQVSGGLGAQDTTVFDRVPDPSPFPQDQHGILVNAKSTSDTTLASNMIECDDTFTFTTARSLIFDRALWGPYPSALAEGKPPPEPPPDSEGHANTQMSPSKGAAYFARQRSLWDGRKFCSAQLCEKFRGTTSTTFPPSSSSGYRCVVVLAS